MGVPSGPFKVVLCQAISRSSPDAVSSGLSAYSFGACAPPSNSRNRFCIAARFPLGDIGLEDAPADDLAFPGADDFTPLSVDQRHAAFRVGCHDNHPGNIEVLLSPATLPAQRPFDPFQTRIRRTPRRGAQLAGRPA